MTAATEPGPAAPPCAVMAPASTTHPCVRPLGHPGPHQHPRRGEWLNLGANVETCLARTTSNLGAGRCRRDPGHAGAHADYKRGVYWQSEETS